MRVLATIAPLLPVTLGLLVLAGRELSEVAAPNARVAEAHATALNPSLGGLFSAAQEAGRTPLPLRADSELRVRPGQGADWIVADHLKGELHIGPEQQVAGLSIECDTLMLHSRAGAEIEDLAWRTLGKARSEPLRMTARPVESIELGVPGIQELIVDASCQLAGHSKRERIRFHVLRTDHRRIRLLGQLQVDGAALGLRQASTWWPMTSAQLLTVVLDLRFAVDAD